MHWLFYDAWKSRKFIQLNSCSFALAGAATSSNPFANSVGGEDLFASSQAPAPAVAATSGQSLGMGEILTPQVMTPYGTKAEPEPQGLGKDLNSSLVMAAEGLCKW